MDDLARDATQLDVRNQTQLLLDNVVIESVQDLTRRWHRPRRIVDEPVLRKDRPWEHLPYFTYSNFAVIRDPDDGLFKCWYEDLDLRPDPPPGPHIERYARQCYAVSEDGLTWTKPELDVLAEDGRATNIVLGSEDVGVHSMSVVLDPAPPTPGHRFRALYTRLWDDGERGFSRIECARSPDGIHWTVEEQPPRFGRSGPQLCDVSCLFVDPDTGQFVQNTRHWLHRMGPLDPDAPRTGSCLPPHRPHDFAARTRRRVFQSRSSDFVHWSEPVLVAAADDAEDNLDEQFYGMAQFRAGSSHLATLGVLRAVDNEMDVQLLHSRDGLRWGRTNKRQPLLAPRGPGHWDAHMVSLPCPPVPVGDELWFFHGGTNLHHDWWMTGGREGIDHREVGRPDDLGFGLGVAALRRDGFASLAANEHREGILVTRPLLSDGTRLVINARCGEGGSIRVAVVDLAGEPVGRCTRDTCDPFTGDAVAAEVTWSGDPTVPVPPGPRGWRRLHFHLRNAELFSFAFDR